MKTTTTEKTLTTIRKTGQATKSAKTPLKPLSLKPVRSMKRTASLKVRPVINPVADKEAL